MQLLTDSATIYIDGGNIKEKYSLYKASSAEKHKSSDDTTLKTALIQALCAQIDKNKTHQGNGVYRFKINEGKGYLVYLKPANAKIPNSACIFHYHWNYTLDMPLVIQSSDV